MITLNTSLEQGGLIPLQFTYDPVQGAHLTIRLSSKASDLFSNLAALLRLTDGSRHASFTHTSPDALAATLQSESLTFEVHLNNRAITGWRVEAGALVATLPDTHRLSVMELRMLGQFPHACVPYSRQVLDKATRAYAPLTDLHTHLTSQIRAQALLEAGAAVNACYPVELLALLGVDTRHFTLQRMDSTLFTPAASDGLLSEKAGKKVDGVSVREVLASPEVAERLRASMEIAYDEVIPFDTLERRIYRMRNPLAKNPDVVEGMILRIAEDYAAQGIAYAELAVTAAQSPDWLARAVKALRHAETRTGVALRLLAALPRSLSPMEALKQLEMIKRVAQHPYVVGVDFLGYEANKTRNFGWALSNIARFARAQHDGIDRTGSGWHFPDDFILRVHAGENGKNPDNVAEVLAIAEKHGVRVRVGHAAYGNDQVDKKRAQRLAEAGLLMMEFNPDSNMAMNNIDRAEQLPIKQWADIPFVIASDGAGVYQTDNRQLLAAGIFAGLEMEDLARMRAHEEAHIARQHALFEAKSAAYHARHGDDEHFIAWLKREKTILQAVDVMDRLAPKRPLLIAGASGSSWGRIDMATQRDIRSSIRHLVNVLNPERVYFAMGRIKQEGIGQALDDALAAREEALPEALPFDVVGMLSGHQNMPALAEYINHIVPLSGELMSVPTQMTALLQTHGGCAIYIGGSAFTRDFISCSKMLGIPFGVMANVAGASGEKAKVLSETHVFQDASGLVAHVRRMMGEDVFLS